MGYFFAAYEGRETKQPSMLEVTAPPLVSDRSGMIDRKRCRSHNKPLLRHSQPRLGKHRSMVSEDESPPAVLCSMNMPHVIAFALVRELTSTTYLVGKSHLRLTTLFDSLSISVAD